MERARLVQHLVDKCRFSMVNMRDDRDITDRVLSLLCHVRRVISRLRSVRKQYADFVMNFIMNLCNPIIVLSNGTKIAEGTAEQIKSDQSVVNAYLGG